MEKEVFAKLQSDFGLQAVDKNGFPIVWGDLVNTMVAFNIDQSHGDANEHYWNTTKVQILTKKLEELGLPAMRPYNKDTANKCRIANLRNGIGEPLKQSDYPGTILKTDRAQQYKNAICN